MRRSLPPKLFAGDRVRSLRDQHRLSQAALATLVGISPSYFNQIEHDQRPLPDAVLQLLCRRFGVDRSYFDGSDGLHLATALREVMSDPLFGAAAIDTTELNAMVRVAPSLANRVMTLYRHHLEREEQIEAHRRSSLNFPGSPLSNSPYDEVRDWVQSHNNHFGRLDRAAELLAERQWLVAPGLRESLSRYLRDAHGTEVVEQAGLLEQGLVWRFEPDPRRILLAEGASTESRVFWMAHHLGLLEQCSMIDGLVDEAEFSSDEARALARVSLANYFAGALMMPYGRFLEAAKSTKYDIQRLQRQFAASFEQVCHRLSTLQRPSMPGIPFYFVKTDIAGNVLKRSSATRFQFTQFGGPCPLWNVYRSFSQPGQISVQIARTPDNVTYLNVACTVGRSANGYLSRPRAVAVVLGCEIQYAPHLVYAAGLDLQQADGADPIGPGCRACPRNDCRHRAVPPVGRPLDISTTYRGVVPYRMRAPLPHPDETGCPSDRLPP